MTKPKSKHICLPKYTPLFKLDQWQCGCGKYFSTKEEALMQLYTWAKHNKMELASVKDLKTMTNEIKASITEKLAKLNEGARSLPPVEEI